MQGQKPGLYLAIRPKTMQGKTVFIMPQANSSKDGCAQASLSAMAGARCPFACPDERIGIQGFFFLSSTAQHPSKANKKIKILELKERDSLKATLP
jgi:hypothetical protein